MRKQIDTTATKDLQSSFVGDDLYETLKAHVNTSPVESRILSERQLAQRYSLSVTSVHRVINRLVEEGLIVKAHGRGSFVAQRSARSQHDAASVLFFTHSADPRHSFFLRQLQGVMEHATANGVRVQVMEQSQLNLQPDAPLARELERDDVMGLFVPWIRESVLTQLRKLYPRLNIVFLGEPPAKAAFPRSAIVGIDEYNAGIQAANHLHARGVNRYTCFSWCREFQSGFRDGLSLYTTPDESALFFLEIYQPETWPDPHAILAANPQALVFSDDRMFSQFIDPVLRNTNAPSNKPLIVLRCNAGEEDAWPEAIRLVTDGTTVGSVAMHVMRGLASGDIPAGTTIRLPITLLEPDSPTETKGGSVHRVKTCS